MAKSPEFRAHQEWLGYLQPVGLVVSPPALLAAQAHINRNIVPVHQRFLEHVADVESDGSADVTPVVTDLPELFHSAFDWAIEDLVGGPGADPLPSDLEVNLPEYNETLRPTYAVPEPEPEAEGASRWQLLIQTLENGTSLDAAHQKDERRWQASPQSRFERLLRETGVPAGLLANGPDIRLVYAPRGGTSGYVTFPVKAMTEVAGRPIFAALHMLLSSERLFTLPRNQRLPAILSESRKYQNEVSTKLADQVLGALWELLRGLQAADEAASGRLLSTLPRENPDHIYGGLLTVLLRLVFLLYAEDRGLMPGDSVYAGNYAVAKLYERLREDAGRYPDTMDQRYGAWAWLLSLFRLVFDGGGHGRLHLPARHGQLFNPDEYPFLEGRPQGVARVMGERIDAPRISDGCVHRVLQGLLVLDGERLSYRSLDVEQIGSVYEAMMGFEVEQAPGRSIGVRRRKKGMDLDVVFNVEALIEVDPSERKKWLKDTAECDLSEKAATALKNASTHEDVVGALGNWVSPRTPTQLPPGALYLQPGEERRRSGSHYTPRELTEPIVRTTLRPVLRALGEHPTPDQVLDLKVCDPAMGSGAFLVEACRQLADELVAAWEVHDCLPEVPLDEDPLLFAQRQVAQRCLYGVDKNPFAVNLAKLSLWLVTLARDHPFTFIDHALRCGDSLVGLGRTQIAAFHWKPQAEGLGPLFDEVRTSIQEAVRHRSQLIALRDDQELEKRQLLWEADDALQDARVAGDLLVAAFFSEDSAKARDARRLMYRTKLDRLHGRSTAAELEDLVNGVRAGERPQSPFHWEIEFPEVFGPVGPGFDTIVGNPPWGGLLDDREKAWISSSYSFVGDFETAIAFVERAFDLTRAGGAVGLLLPNTFLRNDSARAARRIIAECHMVIALFDLTDVDPFPGATVRSCVVAMQMGMPEGRRGAHFRYKRGLPSRGSAADDVSISIDELVTRSHWSDLDRPQIKIPKSLVTVSAYFDAKQGYIPYRKTTLQARYGDEEGERIVNERAWHADHPLDGDYVRELKGRDVSRCLISWSGLWAKYGPWVATYLDPSWFKGRRVLVREIVGKPPRLLIASECTQHFVHNPSIIVLKPSPGWEHLTGFLELYLNSTLASEYIVQVSAKVKKGVFPKVLVKDLRVLPFPRATAVSESVLESVDAHRNQVNRGAEGSWGEIDALIAEVFGV